MGAKGAPKTGGRVKGKPNVKTLEARDIMERLGFDPLEFLFYTAMGDWKALGYDKRTETKVLKDGGTIEVDIIEFSSRLTAAKEAVRYIYPQTKAIEMSTGENGFNLTVGHEKWAQIPAQDHIEYIKKLKQSVDDR